MAKHKYKPGDKVDVFQDPLTRERHEGKATIVSLKERADYYEVHFHGDEPNVTYWRFVYY